MQKLVFFSSDYRGKYKDDIYHVLALPNKYVVHFRYDEKWIDQNVDLKTVKDQEALIFFAHYKKDNGYNNHCIRHATVKEVEITANTGLVHFYLELGDFTSYRIDSNVASEKLPGTKFVSTINVTQNISKQWHAIIDEIKGEFGEGIYFNIISLNDKSGKAINSKYDSSKKSSYYDLNNDTEYHLNYSYYNTKQEAANINFESLDKIVSVFPGSHFCNTKKDNQRTTLVTHTIENVSKPTYFNTKANISYNSEELLQSVPLEVRVTKPLLKSLWFGMLTALVIVISAYLVALFRNIDFNLRESITTLLLCFGIITITSTLVHWLFNKK